MLDNIWELAVVRTCLLGAARDRGSLLWLLPDTTADGPMQRIFHYVVDEWRSQAEQLDLFDAVELNHHFDVVLTCLFSPHKLSQLKEHQTPLHCAALNDAPDVAALLVKSRALVDAVGLVQDKTALHCAALEGHAAVAKVLLDAGADHTATAMIQRRTPCHFAAVRGHPQIVHVLAAAGADLDALSGPLKRTPIHFAASRGHTEVVVALAARGAIVDARDTGGRTALHVATTKGHREVVRALLMHGAALGAKDDKGSTAADLAQVHRVTDDDLLQLVSP